MDGDITYKMNWHDGRCSIGETGVNRLAGVEIAGTVYRALDAEII